MLALSCVGCRAGPLDLDEPGAQPRSLAGAGVAETTKALASIELTEAPGNRADTLAPTGKRKSHLEYCDEGFRSTLDARVDLARLGALCGPSNGLRREWIRSLAVPRTGIPVGYALADAATDAGCGRLAVGFVPPQAGQLVVRSMVSGAPEADVCRLSQSGFCPSDALMCDRRAISVQWVAEERRESDVGNVLTIDAEWWALPRPAPSPVSVVPGATAVAATAEGK